MGLAESKRILTLFKSGLPEEELLARLQQIYDELVNGFFAKVRESNKGFSNWRIRNQDNTD